MTKFISEQLVPYFVTVLQHKSYTESDNLNLEKGQFYRHSKFEITVCERFDDEIPDIFNEVKFINFDPSEYEIEYLNDYDNVNELQIYKLKPKK